MISAFPKIFSIGQDYIRDIFKEEVEITEKIDGSQFVFGRVNGELYARSKGKQLLFEAPEKMFLLAVDYILSIEDRIPDNTVFYCEYLQKPKHNVLVYERVPLNNLALFGISHPTSHEFVSSYGDLNTSAGVLGIDVVPVLYNGLIKSPDDFLSFLERDSILGNTKIEGIVVKNYQRPFLLGGQPIPLMMGKFVSEKFKEVHRKTWGKDHTTKGRFAMFCESFQTEARWNKAIQRLRDISELENAPQDIGKLIKAIQNDIVEEEIDSIKNFLWQENRRMIMSSATRGFPEYYKKYLLEKGFAADK